MNVNEREPNTTAVAICAAVAVGAALIYRRAALAERKKRMQIKLWETQGLECIANAKRRCTEMAIDPDTTAADLLAAMKEEFRFVDIVINQPPY